MAQRDYLLRLIEELGRVAAALRRRILGGELRGAELDAELASLAQRVGLDLALARVATTDMLMLFVAPSGEIDPTRCWMCAEVLYLDALEAEANAEVERARASFSKARLFYSLVAPMGAFLVGFPEAADRIREIDGRLE